MVGVIGQCEVDGCDRVTLDTQVCEKHRWRIRRHGDPNFVLRMWKATRAERLERYVDRSAGPDACWPWTKALNGNGYGVIANRDGGTAVASRAAYEVAHGVTLPRSVVVMHLCDNPPCCNPAHLRAGPMAQNQAHMGASGRAASGERSGQAKLSDAQVVDMRERRAAGAKLTELAESFAVSTAQVSRICNGRQRRGSLAPVDVVGVGDGVEEGVGEQVGGG